MLALGLDIGTTTISAVVINEQHTVIDAVTQPHNTFYSHTPQWERTQDAHALLTTALTAVNALCNKYTVDVIGITGQQHGIVYLDENGNILSPLFTWQDNRGSLPFCGSTYSGHLQQLTGYQVPSGYGLVTHYYNLQNGLVPEKAACLTTIHDLLAMVLCNLCRPVTEPSDAHSLGLFDLEKDDFDSAALHAAGIDPNILPQVKRQTIVGKTAEGIPVAIPIGDNPASFLGATGGSANAVLLNIGTGSQISVPSKHLPRHSLLEVRPYPMGGWLLVGAALCGGRAWAMTERFFSDALFAFTGSRQELYAALDKLLEQTPDDGSHPRITPTFNGTRQDPSRRAAVEGLTADNFTPGKFALGVLHGMIDELHEMYLSSKEASLPDPPVLIGSGNGLRLNKHLQRIASDTFGIPLHLSQCPEEAAVGAAIYAMDILKL